MSARGKGTRGEGLARVGVAWGGGRALRRRHDAASPLRPHFPRGGRRRTFVAEFVATPVELCALVEEGISVRIGLRVVSSVPNARASEVLEWPRWIGCAISIDGIHSENVQLLRVVEVVKVGVGRLRGDLLRDTHVHEGIEGLLLGDHSGRVGDKVAVAHQGTHDGASDASPIRIGFNREGGCWWRRRWRR